jgi:hypothetical protein
VEKNDFGKSIWESSIVQTDSLRGSTDYIADHKDFFGRVNDRLKSQPEDTTSGLDDKYLLQRQMDETYANLRKIQEEFELQKVKEKIQSLKDELKSDNVAVLNNIIGRSHRMLEQMVEKTIPEMENLYKAAESDLKKFLTNRWKFSLGLGQGQSLD